jgi:hypothetical protein
MKLHSRAGQLVLLDSSDMWKKWLARGTGRGEAGAVRVSHETGYQLRVRGQDTGGCAPSSNRILHSFSTFHMLVCAAGLVYIDHVLVHMVR